MLRVMQGKSSAFWWAEVLSCMHLTSSDVSHNKMTSRYISAKSGCRWQLGDGVVPLLGLDINGILLRGGTIVRRAAIDLHKVGRSSAVCFVRLPAKRLDRFDLSRPERGVDASEKADERTCQRCG